MSSKSNAVADGSVGYMADLFDTKLVLPRYEHGFEEDEEGVVNAALAILAKRCRPASPQLSDPFAAGKYMQLQLGSCEREHFGVMFLDTRHRMIAFEVLFSGCIDGAEIHPGVIAKRALAHNSPALVIGHCHPSGNNDPSGADRALTARLKQALSLIDVKLLDHFVVTAGNLPVSLAARGWV